MLQPGGFRHVHPVFPGPAVIFGQAKIFIVIVIASLFFHGSRVQIAIDLHAPAFGGADHTGADPVQVNDSDIIFPALFQCRGDQALLKTVADPRCGGGGDCRDRPIGFEGARGCTRPGRGLRDDPVVVSPAVDIGSRVAPGDRRALRDRLDPLSVAVDVVAVCAGHPVPFQKKAPCLVVSSESARRSRYDPDCDGPFPGRVIL